MNILHVTPSYYPATYWGGPIFSVHALNNALARLPEVALKVITTDAAGPRSANRLDVQNLDMSLYPDHALIFTRRMAGASISAELLCRLPSLIRWADGVHLTATYSFPTLPTLLLCRLLNKPVVWSPRGAILETIGWAGVRRKGLKRLWELVCNALIRPGRTAAHVTSGIEQAALQARIPRAKTVVVPNGVDIPDIFLDRERLSNGKFRLMYLGRISPIKGIENLLMAVRKLDHPGITLSIYGSGQADYKERVEQLAADLSFRDATVTFAGHVIGEAKTQAFHSADVCIIPSFSENFCMVAAESLAHGVPIIASHGTPWKRVEEKGCGLWVDNSPESLARAITKIRTMPLPEMGRRGREWMGAEYSWDAVASAMLDVYRKLIFV